MGSMEATRVLQEPSVESEPAARRSSGRGWLRLAALTAAFVTMITSARAAPEAAPEPPGPAGAPEIDQLRAEIRELREQVRALQEQMRLLQSQAGSAANVPPPAPEPAAPPAESAPPPSPAPVRQQSPNLLNPAISAVFQTIGDTSLSRRDEENGFDLSEAEIALQSVVDPYAKVDLFLSFPAGDTPEVEEGFLTTLALPGSLQLKAGRFKNAFGKWNTLHTHAFNTVDRPDALVNFLGEESLTSDGLSLSVLVPNPWSLYIDSITEVGTALDGESFNSDTRHLTWLQHLSTFFNTSANSTFEIGVTAARGRTGPTQALLDAIDEAGLGGAVAPREDLDSAVYGADLTFKWKPLQLNVYRSFLWQTELLQSHRQADRLSPAAAPLALERASVTSLGGYTYVEGQFSKRWKEGIRADVSGFPDDPRAREWSSSAVVRFIPSEFQELRFQVKHVRRNDAAALRFDDDNDDTRIFLEWIPVIGAHGAHKY